MSDKGTFDFCDIILMFIHDQFITSGVFCNNSDSKKIDYDYRLYVSKRELVLIVT